jgi:hypothetical protein
MHKIIFKILLLNAILLLIIALPLHAQKKNLSEITEKDKVKLEKVTSSIIKSYEYMVNFLTNKEEDDEEKSKTKNGIDEIFNSKGVTVPDDFNDGKDNIEIEKYLSYVMDSVVGAVKQDETLILTQNGELRFYIDAKKNIIAVGNYTQLLNIKKPKVNKKKKPVIIYFICSQDALNNKTARILNIFNENNNPNTEKNWSEITVIKNKNNNDIEVEEPYQGYCIQRIKQANYLLKKKDFGDCYYCLQEAKKNTSIPKSAAKDISELTTKLISEVGDDYKDKLFAQLKDKAIQLERNKQYKQAYEYFLTCELLNGKLDSITEGIQRCSGKALKLNQLEILYFNNKIQDALTGYESLINFDPNDGILYANLGKCYGALDNITEAKNNFAKALKLDDKNATIHKLQAEYYISKKSYAKAIENYNNCLLYTEDNSPEMQKTKAAIAYTYACLNKTISQTAIDSCFASLQYYPQDNPEPCILLSDLLKTNYNNALLFADSAINNSKYNKAMLCKAYAQKARAISKELRNERDDKKATQYYTATKNYYNMALESNRANNEVAFEYGDFLLNDAIDDMKLKNDKEFAKLDSAKFYFEIGSHGFNKDFGNKCIWKKAKCNMMLGNYSEAKNQLTEDLIKQLIVKDKAMLDLAKIKLYNNQITESIEIAQGLKSNAESEYIILLCKLKRNQTITNYNEETLKDILKALPMKMVETDFEKLGIDYSSSSTLKSVIKELRK